MQELFISDDYHILTWFFRVEVRPLLTSRLFLLKLGCVGKRLTACTNFRVQACSCSHGVRVTLWPKCFRVLLCMLPRVA